MIAWVQCENEGLIDMYNLITSSLQDRFAIAGHLAGFALLAK
jgi:hypothetical protein